MYLADRTWPGAEADDEAVVDVAMLPGWNVEVTVRVAVVTALVFLIALVPSRGSELVECLDEVDDRDEEDTSRGNVDEVVVMTDGLEHCFTSPSESEFRVDCAGV